MTSLTASTSFVFLPSSRLPPRHNFLFLPLLPSFNDHDYGDDNSGWPKIRRTRRRSGSGSRRREKIPAAEAEDAFAMDGGSIDLERQVFEFMRSSGRPNDFPTKEELIAAGRGDLAQAIAAHGGWLAFGWDLGGDDNAEKIDAGGNLGSASEVLVENGRFQADVSLYRVSDGSGAALTFLDSEDFSAASYSGRTLEMENIEDSGIEGIISRLEKERSLAFGMDTKGTGATTQAWMNAENDPGDKVLITHKWKSASIGRNIRAAASESDENFFHDSDSGSAENENLRDVNGTRTPMDMWRNLSVQGLGYSEKDFEDAEKAPVDEENMLEHDLSNDEPMTNVMQQGQTVESDIETNESIYDKNHIRIRLRHLEADLASALQLLRSRSSSVISDKCQESSMDELHSLSDAWEFQETELMSARDKLRSIRAKLAILEGKMALEMIQAQKIMEEKQRRLNAAQHALSLLRTACIIWPNNATEVLLAGSFDGWTSQRRMERSSSGIFSLHLRLYPGRYEIKFIVDGVWKVDPLRPIVHNNGHENNLLIIP